MPICPECKEEINKLYMDEEEIIRFEVTINEEFELQYLRKDEEICDCVGYYCPICNSLLFTKGYEAEYFLKE